MQIVFYDMSLLPSYEIYDRRTEGYMHGFIDLRGEDWFLQKGRAVSSPVDFRNISELLSLPEIAERVQKVAQITLPANTDVSGIDFGDTSEWHTCVDLFDNRLSAQSVQNYIVKALLKLRYTDKSEIAKVACIIFLL
jgi:hypothetical protein